MAPSVPSIQHSPAPVAYQLIAQLVPIYSAHEPTMRTPVPSPPTQTPSMSLVLIPLAESPQSPIILVPAIAISNDLSVGAHVEPQPQQPMAAHLATPTSQDQTVTAVTMTQDSNALRALAVENTHWDHLSAVQPISPPSSPSTHVLNEDTPIALPTCPLLSTWILLQTPPLRCSLQQVESSTRNCCPPMTYRNSTNGFCLQ